MALELFALCLDANDPERLARFWAGMLDWDVDHGHDALTLQPRDGTAYRIRILPTDVPKTMPNRTHLDLTSTSLQDQQATVARALELGGRHLDIGQSADDGHVVLADPDGNELCVIEPGNRFLADTGRIGAINGDGSQQVGYFWSRALGWPLVWDQHEETAIQSPRGGSKMSWGGGPDLRKPAKNRIHFDLVPAAGSDQAAEVKRLESLGAKRVDIGHGDVVWVVMTDPDGNEFCLLPPRRAV